MTSLRYNIVAILLVVLLLEFDQLYCSQRTSNDEFDENLYLKPLADGKLLAHFQFKTLYRKDIKNLRWESKIEILPLSIVDLVASTDLNRLHFSLTKGNWNYKNWGYPVRSSPPGSQIRAQFSKHNEDSERSWQRLTNSLAGMFCASLMSADKKTLVPTKLAFIDQSTVTVNTTEHILYSNLPDETLCTENLTPWKKLLPCYSNSGLALLLNPVKLFKSSYSSLSIDLEPKPCPDESNVVDGCEQVQLTQSLTVVFNPLVQFESKQTWSVAKLFGTSITSLCPLASHSRVHVDITDLDDKNKLYPQNYQEYSLNIAGPSQQVRRYATYDLASLLSGQSSPVFNLGIKQNQIFKRPAHSARPIIPVYLRTYIAGLGASDGTIVASISNSLDEKIRITYMHVVPHFLRVYLHTLTIRTRSNQELKPDKLNFILSHDQTSTLIELSINIPPNSETQISYDFDRAFLRWSDYKPDANKGILMGSSMISIPSNLVHHHLVMPWCSSYGRTRSINGSTGNITSIELVEFDESSIRIYAKPLLVILPTPDFSMPYNVLCIVSTVLVSAFGPLYQITTTRKRFKIDPKSDTAQEESRTLEQEPKESTD